MGKTAKFANLYSYQIFLVYSNTLLRVCIVEKLIIAFSTSLRQLENFAKKTCYPLISPGKGLHRSYEIT